MEKTIVEYFAEHECYRCGYCNSSDTNYSHGMWAHTMTPEVYQGLIDRGWRRSGHYIYKPTNNVTCCPTYPIRCHVTEFKLTKSQKKVIKKMNEKCNAVSKNRLVRGGVEDQHNMVEGHINHLKMDVSQIEEPEMGPSCCGNDDKKGPVSVGSSVQFTTRNDNASSSLQSETFKTVSKEGKCKKGEKSTILGDKESEVEPKESGGSSNNAGSGDKLEFAEAVAINELQTPLPRRKRREFRLQKRKERLEKQGKSSDFVNISKEKTLSDLILENDITIQLVPFNSEEFEDNFKDSHALYQKYQMKVHDDTEAECSPKQFRRFLCDSPLVPTLVYGSYHQLYKKNNHLIGVGVIDILPSCVSSVYFFYDPDLPHLSMGTYGALREIYFTQQLNAKYNDILYYYMGFYIHSCPKMKYKGNYFPSFLLCPEMYQWRLLDDSIKKLLDGEKYTKLCLGQPQPQDVQNVMILKNRKIWEYRDYNAKDDKDEISQYCNLVGNANARKMLLYRK